jgi:hypothetical protein
MMRDRKENQKRKGGERLEIYSALGWPSLPTAWKIGCQKLIIHPSLPEEWPLLILLFFVPKGVIGTVETARA